MIEKPKSKQSSDEFWEYTRSLHGKPCIICSKPSVPCHIRSRGAGGLSDPNSVIPMCVPHHNLQGSKGWKYMWDKFVQIRVELTKRGWEVKDILGVYKLAKID